MSNDLVGRAEIAGRAGIRRNTVKQWEWRYSGDYPTPIGEIDGRPVWEWPVIQEWMAKRGLPGSPKSPKRKRDAERESK